MADAKTTPKKKAAKKATHPKYIEMILNGITSLKDKKGSSRVAILKFISTEYKVGDNPNAVNNQLKLALKKGVADGVLTQVKGSGASGSFKVAKSAPKLKSPKKKAAKKVVKPKVAKKAGVKKPAAKKATKKPAAKKSPKKAAKKPAAKKPAAKKPAAKKTSKPKVKKAAKKAAKK